MTTPHSPGQPAQSSTAPASPDHAGSAAAVRGKLFIQTHGCQMNEYDSSRMADVLAAAEGLELTDNVEEADVVLVNTCSIREKAQEKVFSQLGRWKSLKKDGKPVLIGVGGCVASQEGEAIIKRAPYVDLVFGPQTLHRLPELIRARRRRKGCAGQQHRSESPYPLHRPQCPLISLVCQVLAPGRNVTHYTVRPENRHPARTDRRAPEPP